MKFFRFAPLFSAAASVGVAPLFSLGATAEVRSIPDTDSESASRAIEAAVVPRSADAETPPSFCALAAHSVYRPASDISGGAGNLAAWTWGADASFFTADRQNIFFGEFGYERVDYRFRGVEAPFGSHEQLNLSLFYERVLSPKWSLLAVTSGALAVEKGVGFEDGAIGRVGGGIKYTVSKDLSFYSGVIVANRLSDDPSWFPYAGLAWRISPYWSLRTSTGLTLTYDVFADNTLRFELSGGYHGASFRMKNANTGAGASQKRAMRMREGEIMLGVAKEFFHRAAYIRASAGATFLSKYKIRGHGAADEFETDPSAVFRIEAGVRF